MPERNIERGAGYIPSGNDLFMAKGYPVSKAPNRKSKRQPCDTRESAYRFRVIDKDLFFENPDEYPSFAWRLRWFCVGCGIRLGRKGLADGSFCEECVNNLEAEKKILLVVADDPFIVPSDLA